MQQINEFPPSHPSPTVHPEQATGRARVRFNSSAAEIPPPLERRSYSRVSEPEANHITNDQHQIDAEQLLNAHNASKTYDESQFDTEHFSAAPLAKVDTDENYAVTGNTGGGVFYQLLQAYKNPIPPMNETPSDHQALPHLLARNGTLRIQRRLYNLRRHWRL